MKFKVTYILLLLSLLTFLAPKAYSQADGYLPFAQVMPSPVNGLKAIYKNIKYPEMAKQAGVEGKVYLLVYVNEKGSVDNVKIVKDIGAGCGQAAAKGVKDVKFNPGQNKGKPVKVKLSIPVTFKLNQ